MIDAVKRPETADVAKVVLTLLNEHRAGCCAHVIVSDFNLEDQFFPGCLELAEEQGHEVCKAAIVELSKLRKTARRKAIEMAYEAQRERRNL